MAGPIQCGRFWSHMIAVIDNNNAQLFMLIWLPYKYSRRPRRAYVYTGLHKQNADTDRNVVITTYTVYTILLYTFMPYLRENHCVERAFFCHTLVSKL